MTTFSLPLLAAILSCLFWVFDSLIDTHIFGEDDSFIESLINPDPVELYIRTFVVILLISFSFYARHLLAVQKKLSDRIVQHKEQLEDTVASRTRALHDEIEVRKKAEAALEKLATTDPLTSALNRRKFSEILRHEIRREQRYKSGLFLIMCDLDNFKSINDRFGHNTGDMVLVKVSELMRKTIRRSDIFARWGGEEFIFLIPNTDSDLAKEIAENLRRLIEKTEFDTVGMITASFGVAFFEEGDDENSLINRADNTLYAAKKNGRNMVEIQPGSNSKLPH